MDDDDLQWSHGDVAMEIGRNAATDDGYETDPSMEPWRCSHGDLTEPLEYLVVRDIPSMEPWRCSHGDVEISTPWTLSIPLQWSHGDVAMEIGLLGIFGGMAADLQWSHGDVAMEILGDLCLEVSLTIPSMEPWRCSHGDPRQKEVPELQEPPSMEPWRCSHGDGTPRNGPSSWSGVLRVRASQAGV